MAGFWPCDLPAPDAFGLSPTWHVCGCSEGFCEPDDTASCAQGACECTVQCGQIDWKVDCCGLSTNNQVSSAVLYSLAMRRRINDDDVVDQGPCQDRGGWYGNQYIDTDWNPGTILWTRRNSRYDPNQPFEPVNFVTQEINDALDYLRTIGIIDDADIQANIDECGFVCVRDLNIRPELNEPERSQWAWMWATECCERC